MRLLNRIKKFFKIYLLGQDAYELRLNEYRKAGIKVGENCSIYSSLPMGRDCCLLSIGDNVTISGECGFINHDNAIIKPTKGQYTDLLGEIIIGNNCFIGYRSIILPGVSLADNTIVGMGSVVTKSVKKPGLVIAGNPAKVICTVKEYCEKNLNYMVNLNGMSAADVKEYVSMHPEMLLHRAEQV